MIIIGSDYIDYDRFEGIKEIKEINHTSSNSVVVSQYNLETMKYCYENKIPYAIFITTITQALFANSLGAKYLLIENHTLATKIQKLAENYMFDSKVLAIIENDSEIESLAINEIDGIIYNKILKGLKI